MLEEYALYVCAVGVLIGVIGYFWLVGRAFKQTALRGLAVLFFPPMGLVFVCRPFRKVVGPVCVLLLAGLVFGAPFAFSYYERHFVPLAPYEQVVDGEL